MQAPAAAAAGIIAYLVAVRSVEFCGAISTLVSRDQYQAATPDPLWREAPGILRHLEQGHMGDLIGCVRAHGMRQADWVIPPGLDRYGLELLVLTPGWDSGDAAVLPPLGTSLPRSGPF